MRHYVQVIEPMGLPMFVDGMFVSDELVEYRAHPIVDGVIRERMDITDGEPLMLAIIHLLRSTYNASNQMDEGHSSDPHGRCKQN